MNKTTWSVEIGVDYWNFRQILNLYFLLIFSWKYTPNSVFWFIFKLLRCLNSKKIKLQRKKKIWNLMTISIFYVNFTLQIWTDLCISSRDAVTGGFQGYRWLPHFLADQVKPTPTRGTDSAPIGTPNFFQLLASQSRRWLHSSRLLISEPEKSLESI